MITINPKIRITSEKRFCFQFWVTNKTPWTSKGSASTESNLILHENLFLESELPS